MRLREHSRLELQRKLSAGGTDAALVDATVAECAAQGLQSDTRYAETYARQRADRGYGPSRIFQELKQRGIDDASARLALAPMVTEWNELIQCVRRKRFGAALPADATERARQARFLQYRGFTAEQIRSLLNDRAYGD